MALFLLVFSSSLTSLETQKPQHGTVQLNLLLLVMSVEEFKLIPLLHSMEADLDKRIRLMSEM